MEAYPICIIIAAGRVRLVTLQSGLKATKIHQSHHNLIKFWAANGNLLQVEYFIVVLTWKISVLWMCPPNVRKSDFIWIPDKRTRAPISVLSRAQIKDTLIPFPQFHFFVCYFSGISSNYSLYLQSTRYFRSNLRHSLHFLHCHCVYVSSVSVRYKTVRFTITTLNSKEEEKLPLTSI